ncbi:unnamed protein product [Chrysodeixis includens]|uniref:Defensin n=1 Tax=Chrysodeixis includens TaxID=689277 RepID=A0A9P0BYJ4_CHRIL|nr:unnamed protein product [Chrysodeixis includens]
MELKAVNVFLVIALSACLVQNAIGMPTDSSAVHEESVVTENSEVLQAQEETVKLEKLNADIAIPGRVSCEYEEATEATVCQEHCLPKGYNYGICVSHTCSCI